MVGRSCYAYRQECNKTSKTLLNILNVLGEQLCTLRVIYVRILMSRGSTSRQSFKMFVGEVFSVAIITTWVLQVYKLLM